MSGVWRLRGRPGWPGSDGQAANGDCGRVVVEVSVDVGQQVVLTRIVRGDVLGPADWAIPSLVALAIAAGAVALVSRLLREERIVFGRS